MFDITSPVHATLLFAIVAIPLYRGIAKIPRHLWRNFNSSKVFSDMGIMVVMWFAGFWIFESCLGAIGDGIHWLLRSLELPAWDLHREQPEIAVSRFFALGLNIFFSLVLVGPLTRIMNELWQIERNKAVLRTIRGIYLSVFTQGIVQAVAYQLLYHAGYMNLEQLYAIWGLALLFSIAMGCGNWYLRASQRADRWFSEKYASAVQHARSLRGTEENVVELSTGRPTTEPQPPTVPKKSVAWQ
jgi:hypothetical protein